MAGRRIAGLAAFGGALAVGTLAGWVAERRLVADRRPEDDPEWAQLAAPVDGRTTRVESFDGTLLHAEVLGEDVAPTIVLVHGYLMAQEFWRYQRLALSQRYRVVTYDQRGHARSQEAASGDYSVGALGRDLDAVLEALAPERALVVGHSMGGMSVLSYADLFPDAVPVRLAGAVLMDTAASGLLTGILGRAPAMLAQATAALAPAVLGLSARAHREDSDIAQVIARLVAFSPSASPAQVAFAERLALQCPAVVRAALMPAMTALDLRHAVKALSVPVLLLYGAVDRITPPDHGRRLAAALPDARLVVLEGVGHMPPLEAPELVDAHVRRLADEVFA